MSSLFYNLTPDMVIQAAVKSGYEPTGHCLTLNSYENRVFDLMLEDDNHIILKFYRPERWNELQITEEHQFLFDLDAQEIPVCKPFLLPTGKSVATADGIFFTIWPRTGGRSADEFSDNQVEILGRLLARIHNTGEAVKNISRPVLNSETYAREPLNFLIANSFVTDHFVKRISTVVLEIAAIYDELAAGVPLHRIHGDCHTGNLLYGNEGFYFLDFDDFLSGPAVQDIWMLLPAKDPAGIRQRQIFIDSYRQFRPFEDSWLELIEPLRAFRYIHYAAWIARRWTDPAFKMAFSHFGTDNYWEELTLDLEDQLKVIKKQKNHFTSATTTSEELEEEELGNSDFFWDWEEK